MHWTGGAGICDKRGMKHFAVFLAAALALAPPAARAADPAPSAEVNQAFAADKAKRKGVVTLPSGLQYRVLHSGPGKRPGPADIVQLNYSGRLVNGVLFDGTSPGLPVTVPVNGVIRGLNQALLLMHEGDRWQLVVPPDLAYGAKGVGNGLVPPDQTLVFDLTLISTIPAPQAASQGLTSSVTILSADSAHGAMLTIHP
jgi:FKBP-type peptidyl-prolyl cis-trans isomerase